MSESDHNARRPFFLNRLLAVCAATCTFILIPLLSSLHVIADSDVNRLGRYLCFAIAAVGIDVAWGYGGILAFCQALIFGIAAIATAMFMSLPQGGGDVRPEYHMIPQFFYYNNVDRLPTFWKPFASLPIALLIGLTIILVFTYGFGYLAARQGVSGSYFSVSTLVIQMAAYVALCQNQLLLGGTNGLTNFYKPLNTDHDWILCFYLLTATALVIVVLVTRYLFTLRKGSHAQVKSIATTLRTSAETLAPLAISAPKYTAVFLTAMGICGFIGGALYPAQNGIFTPNAMRVQDSVLMVACVAVGGRRTLWGAVAGSLFVNYLSSTLTTDAPDVWPIVFGCLFIASVLRKGGLSGLWMEMQRRIVTREQWRPLALLLLGLIVFVLAEALGLMPALMEARYGGIPIKYYCLVACSAWYMWELLRRRASGGTPV